MALAKQISFPFDEEISDIFSRIHRPIASIDIWSNLLNNWIEVITIVDTGADYTLLPRAYADNLGIDLKQDCESHKTFGVGGTEIVHLYRQGKMRLGPWEFEAPMGFLTRSDIPPLLGRQQCLERFKLTLSQHRATFSDFKG